MQEKKINNFIIFDYILGFELEMILDRYKEEDYNELHNFFVLC